MKDSKEAAIFMLTAYGDLLLAAKRSTDDLKFGDIIDCEDSEFIDFLENIMSSAIAMHRSIHQLRCTLSDRHGIEFDRNAYLDVEAIYVSKFNNLLKELRGEK